KYKAIYEKSIDQGSKHIIKGKIIVNIVVPTILTDVTSDMAVAQEEMFGPVVSVIPFETDEEAVKIANNTNFALSGAVHTAEGERGVELAKKVHTGMIHVNDITINDEAIVAFGGEKQSGLGRLNGEWSLEDVTTMKWISINYRQRQFPY